MSDNAWEDLQRMAARDAARAKLRLEMLDKYTRSYFEAQCVVLGEFSHNIHAEQWRLLDAVNADREACGLSPLDVPSHWPNREGEYV